MREKNTISVRVGCYINNIVTFIQWFIHALRITTMHIIKLLTIESCICVVTYYCSNNAVRRTENKASRSLRVKINIIFIRKKIHKKIYRKKVCTRT